MLDKGVHVRVIDTTGNRFVVEKVEPGEDENA
jgi:hypothetical protein